MMNKLIAFTVAFTAQIAISSAISTQELHDMSIKSIMDAPYMTHIRFSEKQLSDWKGIAPKGQAKYQALSYTGTDFPEIYMLEDFLGGFLKGSSFAGNSQCKSALQGMLYQGFEVVKNREIYNPSKIMKATIAIQKLQEQQSLFYVYCDFSHLYRIAGQLTQFNDYKQYGQLLARAAGIAVSDGSYLIPCITEGAAGLNNKDFEDVGVCVGQMSSQILDAQF